MRTKIKLSGDAILDIEILLSTCSNNNQICYHLSKNKYLIDYLQTTTGLSKVPVVVLLYHFMENLKEIPKCICGRDRKYHCHGYRLTCGSNICKNLVREESKKKFCLHNYGVEYAFQSDKVKKKIKDTVIIKYGVDNISKSNSIIQKRRRNNIIKYGVTDPIMLKNVRGDESKRGNDKIQNGLPNGYFILDNDKNKNYRISCPNGHTFSISKGTMSKRKKNNIKICSQCNDKVGSNGEQDLYNYISSIYHGEISRSNRKLISPFEIDMVIPELKLCIEFNGDYWHSNKIINDKNYHLNKLNMCLLNGYRLIQIRENDWKYHKDEIKIKIFNVITNTIDIKDFNIFNDDVIIDLSWFDNRILDDEFSLKSEIPPSLIKVGQYNQWDCGYKIYTKK